MKKFLVAATLVAAGSFCLQGVSIGHGGTYRGPGDTVPPGGGGGGGGGGGPQGPGGPGGPAGPDGGSPGGAGPITGAPSTGGPGQTAGGTAAVTGGAIEMGPELTKWSFWWEFNKDPYLNLKAKIHSVETKTGDQGFFTGEGKKTRAKDSFRPSQAVIQDKVVPALLAALDRETNNDIVTGCMIALAKIGDKKSESGESQFEQVFKKFLPDGSQEISETAALSLGILANDASVDLLTDLLLDNESGRAAVGKSEVDFRRRAFAAYGLSLIGNKTASEEVRQNIVGTLAEVLDSSKSSTRDIKVACLIGIGLVPIQTLDATPAEDGSTLPPNASRMAQIDYLRRYFNDENNHYLVQAHAPSALARLIDGLPEDRKESAKAMVAADLLVCIGKRTASKSKNEIQQSAVLALGQLGDCDEDEVDKNIRKALAAVGSVVSDQQVRYFSRIALGQVGGRSGTSGDPASGRKEISSALSKGLSAGNAGARWSGIGIGVMGRMMAKSQANALMPEELSRALRSELDKAKSPDDVGAFCVAAGILSDLEAKDILLEKLDRMSQDEPRGYAAVALGLMNARDAITPIKDIVLESKYRPELLKQAAIALGLLGDKELVPDLISMLNEAKSLATQASISAALGFIGDRRSIDPLIAMLENDSLTGSARGFAAVALGIVADKEALPWNSKIAVDINYRASTVTLNSADAGTGVLNIL